MAQEANASSPVSGIDNDEDDDYDDAFIQRNSVLSNLFIRVFAVVDSLISSTRRYIMESRLNRRANRTELAVDIDVEDGIELSKLKINGIDDINPLSSHDYTSVAYTSPREREQADSTPGVDLDNLAKELVSEEESRREVELTPRTSITTRLLVDKEEEGVDKEDRAISSATTTPSSNDAVDDGKSKGNTRQQLFELIRKRWIISCRDIKGFFFQVVFPTIQILLVLGILTVRINPAGHSIKLNAALINNVMRGNSEIFIGGDTSGWVAPGFAETNGYIQRFPGNTSSEISSIMAAYAFKGIRPKRFGAIVLNDSVAANLTMNWNWVKVNLPWLLQNQAIITAAAGAFGLGNNLNFNTLITQNLKIPIAIPNTAIFANVSVAQAAIDNLLYRVLGANATLFEEAANNATASIVKALESNRAQNTTGYLEASSISYNVNDEVFYLTNVYFVYGNSSILIGNVSVPLSTIISQLPNGEATYFFTIPSEFSVLFNTSSPHSIAAYNGELVSAAFRVCSPLVRYSSTAVPEYLIKNHVSNTNQLTNLITNLLAS